MRGSRFALNRTVSQSVFWASCGKRSLVVSVYNCVRVFHNPSQNTSLRCLAVRRREIWILKRNRVQMCKRTSNDISALKTNLSPSDHRAIECKAAKVKLPRSTDSTTSVVCLALTRGLSYRYNSFLFAFLPLKMRSTEKSVFSDDFSRAWVQTYSTYFKRTVAKKRWKAAFSETIDEIC